MAKAPKRVTVLGNFSGRNAGDAAILEGLLKELSARYGRLLFQVPTINPSFIRRSYKGYCVRPVSLLPWKLSLKMFGLPALRAILDCDLVLVTDAILFDHKLFNPLFNYLSTLALLLPLAKRRAVPVVLYNVSLGTIDSELGRRCLERVIESSEVVILRDVESAQLMRHLGIDHGNVRFGADCALSIEPCSEERLEEICKREGLFERRGRRIGFNINSYIDTYVENRARRISRRAFLEAVAVAVDRVVAGLDAEVLFVATQHMDIGITREAIERCQSKRHIKMVSNRVYSYRELAGILSRLELMVGMRTHSLILASSVGTPVAGIIAYPKTRAYLRSIGQERFLEFDSFSADNLERLVRSAWEERETLRLKVREAVEEQKRRVRESAELLAPFLEQADLLEASSPIVDLSPASPR